MKDVLNIYVYVFGNMCLIILGSVIFWEFRSLVKEFEVKKVDLGI